MSGETKCLNQSIVLRFIYFLWIGVQTIMLSACGSGAESVSIGENNGNSVKTSAGAFTEQQIASALYFDHRVPDGFFKESYEPGAYYIVSHIKNTDLVPVSARAGMSPYELSSNDFTESMGWSETATGFQANYKALVDNSETSMYRQFTRVDATEPEFIHLHRVMKADFIDRSGVDETYKGRLTKADVTSAEVKQIIEYLWTFSIENNYGYSVLTSSIEESSSGFTQRMLQAELSMNYQGACDTVDVYEVIYSVSKASGFINKSVNKVYSFSSERTGDVIKLCA